MFNVVGGLGFSDYDYSRDSDQEDIACIYRSVIENEYNSNHHLNNARDQRNQAYSIQAVLSIPGGHLRIVAHRTADPECGKSRGGRLPDHRASHTERDYDGGV